MCEWACGSTQTHTRGWQCGWRTVDLEGQPHWGSNTGWLLISCRIQGVCKMEMKRPTLLAHCEDSKAAKSWCSSPHSETLPKGSWSTDALCSWKALSLSLVPYTHTCPISLALDRTSNCLLCFPVHLSIFLVALSPLKGRPALILLSALQRLQRRCSLGGLVRRAMTPLGRPREESESPWGSSLLCF